MSDEMLDRFARGELSPAEGRELAQKALRDVDLFDELTSAAIAKTAMPHYGRKRIAWRRIALLTAAAAILLGVVLYRPRRIAAPANATSALPILIAGNSDANAPTFRGLQTETRGPRVIGSVESIGDGLATIDLGSLDGLVKGSEIEVLRDGQSAGKIKLTAIFRDRSRGEIASGTSLRVHDQIRVPSAARLRASLDQIQAAMARGESESARRIALETSVDSFGADLSGAVDLNNAGVIAELHSDRPKALELYQRASQADSSGQYRQAIEKNLHRVEAGK